jgi:hypothetical protein
MSNNDGTRENLQAHKHHDHLCHKSKALEEVLLKFPTPRLA